MSYADVNGAVSKSMESYMVQNACANLPKISFLPELKTIVTDISKGVNPNRVVFRNNIKMLINKLNTETLKETLAKLEQLDFQPAENVKLLVLELVNASARCPAAVKGFTFSPKYKSTPELCVEVLKHFSSLISKSDNFETGFHEETMRLCQHSFADYIDAEQSIDENNENTSDNYKGFMTLMGLLYNSGLISIKVVIDCMDVVRRAIFCSRFQHVTKPEKSICFAHADKHTGVKKTSDTLQLRKTLCFHDCTEQIQATESDQRTASRTQTECMNLYNGYNNMLQIVLTCLEDKTSELVATYLERVKNNDGSDELVKQVATSESSLNKLCDYLNSIVQIHQSFISLNKEYKAKHKETLQAPLRAHALIINNATGDKLNSIGEKLRSSYDAAQTKLVKYEQSNLKI